MQGAGIPIFLGFNLSSTEGAEPCLQSNAMVANIDGSK